MSDKKADYKIYVQPVYIEVDCPHCGETLCIHDGDGINLEEVYIDKNENISVFCELCDEEIYLGEYEEEVTE
ncbi:hypothetical protein [Listeria booriae]|uniref:hypothetical protein n=1 Tax=Listeria booriae TaxID=1552123 RepID=UPI001627E5BB|nr:hypothetical protein [Listeria booriae]MBC2303407.1 hypothetical protein [Listeria booriae]